MREEIKDNLISDLEEVEGVDIQWWSLSKLSVSQEGFPVIHLSFEEDLFRVEASDADQARNVNQAQNYRESILQMKLQVIHNTVDGLEATLQKLEEKLGQKEWDYDGWRFDQDEESETPSVSAVARIRRRYAKNYFEEPGGTVEIREEV